MDYANNKLMTSKLACMFFSLVLCFIFAPSVSAQQNPNSPYRKMNRESLSLALQKMQMGVLLEALADESGDNALKIEALIIQAKTADEEDRYKLLTAAAELVKQQGQRLADVIRNSQVEERDEFENAVIDFYKARLLYINILVPYRTQPYVERMTYLLGGDEDRRALGELTAEALERAIKMEAALDKILADSRDPSKVTRQVYLVPELENIQKRLEYWSAFIRYYNAISQPRYIPDPGQAALKVNRSRINLLEKAKNTISLFASDPDLQDIHSDAKLLQGQCDRELEEFDQAAKLFEWLAGLDGKEVFFVEASFTEVRNLIEWGAFLVRDGKLAEGGQKMTQAQKILNAFIAKAQAKKLQTPLGIDVKKMVLEYYLHQEWADALRTARKDDLAAVQNREIQDVFKNFLAKYKDPAIRVAVGELFRKKFEGTKDLTKLDPGVVLMLADLELAEAKKLQGQANPADLSADVKKKIAGHCDKAETMYQFIINLKNTSPEVADIIPDALWGMGELHVLKLDNFQAAEMFRELVRQYTQNPRAYLAAINAVKINNELINLLEQAGQAVPRKRRLEYAESLRVMLENWGDKPEASQYYFDLAYTCGKLAEGAESDEAFRAFLAEGIRNYEKVPSDSELARWAMYEALDLKYKQLMNTPRPDKAQAVKLMNQLNRYGVNIHDLWRRTNDAEKKLDWGVWGSQCEFHSQIIAGELLGNRDAALAAIEKLPQRWPGTAVLEEAREYAIRQRVERGDVDKAIQQLNTFEKEYGSAKAEGLMELVISKIRQAISQRRTSSQETGDLKKFRQAYLRFAETIYRTQIKNATEGKKNQITAMLADALVQSGTPENASRALALYDELQKIDQASQARQHQEITAIIDRQLEFISNSSRNTAAARTLSSQLQDTIKTLKMEGWRSSSLLAVKYAMRKLETKPGQTPEEIKTNTQANVQSAFEAITRAYQTLKSAMKRKVSVDANIILGMARCYRILKKYPQAIAEYRKLAVGLTPEAGHTMYWETQLELCECILDAYGNSPREMERLRIFIGQLRDIDDNLGGREYLGRFGKIEAQAQKLR